MMIPFALPTTFQFPAPMHCLRSRLPLPTASCILIARFNRPMPCLTFSLSVAAASRRDAM